MLWQDTGDNGEGWNVFATDVAGRVSLARGTHTLVVISSGGDGCVEIDKVSLSPSAAPSLPTFRPARLF